MKTDKNIKLNICLVCMFMGIAAALSPARLQAKPLTNSRVSIAADTSTNNSYKKITVIQRNVFGKDMQALQRLQLLDKLSKQPAENPEVFSNAREEYLYFEKARAELVERDNAIKELNILMSRIIW